jgi:tetratricopeptide (TPR) repeat protein
LAADPRLAQAHVNLGAIRAMQGRLEEAIGHFSEARRLDPSNLDALDNLEKAMRLREAGK